MDLSLNNFSNFFSVFAVLNLGYATSQSFRDAIDDNILKLNNFEKGITADIELIKAKADLLAMSNNAKLVKRIDSYSNVINLKVKALKVEKVKSAEFVRSFKSMFLVTALYSLTFLVLCGYQSSEPCNKNHVIYNILHFLNFYLLIFNTFIFVRSFTKFYDKNLKPFTVTILFFLIIVLSITFSNILSIAFFLPRKISLQNCLALGIIIALSPYLLHFLRAFKHRKDFIEQEKNLVAESRIKLKELTTYIDNITEDLGGSL